ncbi:hypothetical protein [Paracoccus aminophilus]|nr:hypothetical protein [Paracoccus aminophilus]
MRLGWSLAQIRLFSAALHWQGQYIALGSIETAHGLGDWLRCKIDHRSFDAAMSSRGFSRSHGFRLRDRGLSMIAQGLHRDRVPVPRPEGLADD